jgi:hypothetical protein
MYVNRGAHKKAREHSKSTLSWFIVSCQVCKLKFQWNCHEAQLQLRMFIVQLPWRCQTRWLCCLCLQALLPCIAQLSGLPLRELELDVQQIPSPAAFLAPFQRLPRTLRQLQLKSIESHECGANPERTPLPPGLLPTRVQTTALRQVRLDDMLAGSGCRTITSTQHRGSLQCVVWTCSCTRLLTHMFMDS